MVLSIRLQLDSMVPPKLDLYHIGNLISKMARPFHDQHQQIHMQTEHNLYQGRPEIGFSRVFGNYISYHTMM